jgi:hypothetical protein
MLHTCFANSLPLQHIIAHVIHIVEQSRIIIIALPIIAIVVVVELLLLLLLELIMQAVQQASQASIHLQHASMQLWKF